MTSTEYTFDIVAVATFHIGAPDYPTARRAAEGLVEFNVRDNTVSEGHDDPPGLVYSLTYVTPRGKASFVESDPDDASVPAEDYQTFTEPLLDVQDSLREALGEADAALGGDSNDAEHDALASVRETIAAILGVDYDAPSPDYDEDAPRPDDDGFVSLDRNGYHVSLAASHRGVYPTREIAVYELARAMAGDEEFTSAWVTGEHGPALESIDNEICAYYQFTGSEGTLRPLPGVRFEPGDLVTVDNDDWKSWVVAADYGHLGLILHTKGDSSVTIRTRTELVHPRTPDEGE